MDDGTERWHDVSVSLISAIALRKMRPDA